MPPPATLAAAVDVEPDKTHSAPRGALALRALNAPPVQVGTGTAMALLGPNSTGDSLTTDCVLAHASSHVGIAERPGTTLGVSPTVDALAMLRESWKLALRAERKAPETVKSYSEGVRRFLVWCTTQGRSPRLDRTTVSAFVAWLFDGGADGPTARAWQLAVRRFSAWLADEGGIERDELRDLRAPKLERKLIEPLTDEQLAALIAACSTTGNAFRDDRDEALVRFMVETGCRAGETAAMLLPDVNLRGGFAILHRGKDRNRRAIPFGPQTTRALGRYILARSSHRLADSPNLWLGDYSKSFSYEALRQALAMRATQAGIDRFHPHRLRHTAAHRWLCAVSSEAL